MKTYAYLRTGIHLPSKDNQMSLLKNWGYDEIFIDESSSDNKDTDKNLLLVLKRVREGDALAVCSDGVLSLDEDKLGWIKYELRLKGCNLVLLTDGYFEVNDWDEWLFIKCKELFALHRYFEKRMASMKGQRAAMKASIPVGRSYKLSWDDFNNLLAMNEERESNPDSGLRAEDIYKKFGISKACFYRLLKDWREDKLSKENFTN